MKGPDPGDPIPIEPPGPEVRTVRPSQDESGQDEEEADTRVAVTKYGKAVGYRGEIEMDVV